MRIRAVRIIQQVLKDHGYYQGRIDGKRGPKTNRAVAEALAARASDIGLDMRRWSAKRRAVAYFQLICKDARIEVGKIDGLWGPQTDYAYDTLVHLLEAGEMPRPWRDLEPLDVNPNDWPVQTEAALRDFYGPPCEVQLVRVRCPWKLKIAWNLSQSVSTISCHPRVADSLAQVLERVHDEYGSEEISRLRLDLYGGSYNCRKKRGGSTWSNHAWGIAIDWDPAHNRYNWGRDRARFDHPDYDVWWRCWEEEGWLSLGRTRNFDWMHVQAAKLPAAPAEAPDSCGGSAGSR